MIYGLSRNMKNIRICIWKFSFLGGTIFSIFEKACFRDGCTQREPWWYLVNLYLFTHTWFMLCHACIVLANICNEYARKNKLGLVTPCTLLTSTIAKIAIPFVYVAFENLKIFLFYFRLLIGKFFQPTRKKGCFALGIWTKFGLKLSWKWTLRVKTNSDWKMQKHIIVSLYV